MRGWMVNDCRSTIPGTLTLWDRLLEWIPGLEDRTGVPFPRLAQHIEALPDRPDYVVRNASWFRPLNLPGVVQIAFVQDILPSGTLEVADGCNVVVANSRYTAHRYGRPGWNVIPIGTDETIFHPDAPSDWTLPPCCWIWVGSTNPIKGFGSVRGLMMDRPHEPFCLIFKDDLPDDLPPNAIAFSKLDQRQVAGLMAQATRGLCTSLDETQHLAGIEMGLCGCPIVAPRIGAYWDMELPEAGSRRQIREYWLPFGLGPCRDAWRALLCSELTPAAR